VRAAKSAAKPAAKPAVRTVKPVAPVAPPAPPPPPVRKPTYHEAVAMYERGLQALQRRDFAASADALRSVIERYPDERELLERARLYLKVCERELEPKEPAPKTADEWVYAATVALNAGDEAAALQHLQRALTADARHDHAHYMMSVASVRRGDTNAALEHLRRAVALNPENRSIARQDPELDLLRDAPAFKAALDTPPAEGAVARPMSAAARIARPKPRR
jgi:Tfp pilus assembly protein PilF